MENILLLGGAGYVGTVITEDFLSKGYKVTVIDNFTYGNHNATVSFLGNPNYKLIYGNCGSRKDLSRIKDRIDGVIILFGLVGDPITKKYPQLSERVNIKDIKFAIDFFDDKDIQNMVFISTCSNYGVIKENEMADENFILTPLSHYSKAKVEIEKYFLNKKNKVGYTGTVLRFSTAFGISPRMRFDLSISEFVKDLYMGNELDIYDENTWRPYCHVRDFAKLLDMILKEKKDNINFEVFNAGGDENNFTKKMIVDEISKHIPNANCRYVENGSDPRNYRVSFEKVKNIVGFEPFYTVDMGIKELIYAMQMGFFNDVSLNREKYGNYLIKN